MENVKGGWSDLLYCPLGKLVVTMDVKKNHVLVGKERVYDQELIYASVIDLIASSREINFNDVLAFELAAYPPSMFKADGKMNVATSRSTLKHKLQVTISERNCPISDTMIYHVSELLWVITWPSDKLRVYMDAFKAFVLQALRRANVILAFDRYIIGVEAHATKFMCAVYDMVAESCNTLTECRVKMWRSKTGESVASSVNLCAIPPTTEAFAGHVHRCHLQVAIGKAALLEFPPEMDSTKYGPELDHLGILVSRTVPARPLGVALQHVAARKLGAQSSVCVRVRKAITLI